MLAFIYGRFIGNIDSKDEKFVLEAAKQTGFDIAVEGPAVAFNGEIITDHLAVYSHEPIDMNHEPLWNKFREIREQSKKNIC